MNFPPVTMPPDCARCRPAHVEMTMFTIECHRYDGDVCCAGVYFYVCPRCAFTTTETVMFKSYLEFLFGEDHAA